MNPNIVEPILSVALMVGVVFVPTILLAIGLRALDGRTDRIADHRPAPRSLEDWQREAARSARRSQARR